jgi:urea transporter
MISLPDDVVPVPFRDILRGVGQVFFQENALAGACFLLGIAVSSPLMALGGAAGAVIGWATAKALKFDAAEAAAGIYGFNPALVGIATFFFFRPGAASIGLLIAGCVAAAAATRLARRHLPFPTFTAPFVIITWALYFLGPALGAARVEAGGPVEAGAIGAVAHGIGQVMFQASIWTGLLFLAGIALSNWQHAAWVLAGSFIGALVANYHATAAVRAIDPERLVERALAENIALGLYGYNATLAAVALYLWRRSTIPALLGIVLSVPLTELVPLAGIPALTAPFILATWLVMALGRLDAKFLRAPAPS